MKKAIAHLRSNVVGYFALFVALGGTSYAAVSIPANSVGSRQLRDGAVIQKKIGSAAVGLSQIDKRSIPGSIVFWAEIAADGSVLSSSRPVTTANWSTGNGQAIFHARYPRSCFALASVMAGQVGAVSLSPGVEGGEEHIFALMYPLGSAVPGPLPIALAVICPA